jgi:hypothetical protein
LIKIWIEVEILIPGARTPDVSFKIWTCIITSITACPIGWDTNDNFFLDFHNWHYTIYYLIPGSRIFYQGFLHLGLKSRLQSRF